MQPGNRIDQILRYINERTGVNPDCPMCGNNDWSRIGNGWVIKLTVAEIDASSDVPKAWRQNALGLICTKCGFLRLHAVDPESWGAPSEPLP